LSLFSARRGKKKGTTNTNKKKKRETFEYLHVGEKKREKIQGPTQQLLQSLDFWSRRFGQTKEKKSKASRRSGVGRKGEKNRTCCPSRQEASRRYGARALAACPAMKAKKKKKKKKRKRKARSARVHIVGKKKRKKSLEKESRNIGPRDQKKKRGASISARTKKRGGRSPFSGSDRSLHPFRRCRSPEKGDKGPEERKIRVDEIWQGPYQKKRKTKIGSCSGRKRKRPSHGGRKEERDFKKKREVVKGSDSGPYARVGP